MACEGHLSDVLQGFAGWEGRKSVGRGDGVQLKVRSYRTSCPVGRRGGEILCPTSIPEGGWWDPAVDDGGSEPRAAAPQRNWVLVMGRWKRTRWGGD